MNLQKINFIKHGIYAWAIPLWWLCISFYLSTTYACSVGIVGLSGMSCRGGSSTTLVSFVLLGAVVAGLAVLYSLVAFVLAFALPYEHNDDEDHRASRAFTIGKALVIWIAPIVIAISATPPKSIVSAQMLREQKQIDAISGSWRCHAECKQAFPAGEFFSISRQLSGALQIVGTADGKLRSVHDIWPRETAENSYKIELTNTSPPTIINAVFDAKEKTLTIEGGKVLMLEPVVASLKK